MKTFHLAAIATAMLAMSSPALADVIVKDGELANLPHREVRFADLNLDTPEGVDRLNIRISAAVRGVCGTADVRQVREVSSVRDCREVSLQRAFVDRDAILAARMAARGQPDKLAAIDTSIGVGASRTK